MALTLCVTLERYVSVCKPFSKLKLKKFLMPCGIAFAICYNIPKFFEMKVDYFPIEVNGTKVLRPQVVPTGLRLNWWYLNFYFFGFKLVIIELIPYFVLIWLNYQIWSRIKAIINDPSEDDDKGNFLD